MSRIIVGVDGSEHGSVALRWATRRAERSDEEVVALLAWTFFDQGYRPPGEDLRPAFDDNDAKRVLANHVPPESVNTVHVFFPDPWWKSKHKKRLLFTAEFAAAVLRVLKPGGVLHFVTDVADYFAMVTGLLAAVPAFRELPPPAENTPQHDMDYLTNFERKFRREGRPIYRSRYEKRS